MNQDHDGPRTLDFVRRDHSKLPERVAELILEEIQERGLCDGDRLSTEAEMLEIYAVGRATLREALRLLETQGVVRIRPGPGGGPIVRTTGIDAFTRTLRLHLQLRDCTFGSVLAARLQIEPLMVRLAAEGASDADRADITAIAAEATTLAPDDWSGHMANFSAFHDAVLRRSGNDVLDLFALSLRHVFAQGRAPSARPRVERVVREHLEIAQAISERRAVDAERLMSEHMHSYMETAEGEYLFEMNDQVRWLVGTPAKSSLLKVMDEDGEGGSKGIR